MKSLYFSLTPKEKDLYDYYLQFYINSSNSKAFILMAMAADMIPQRHYALAQKLLYRASEITQDRYLSARIHLNLTQLFHDLSFEDPQYNSKKNYHREQVLALGYFEDFINDTF
ncbi:hypothetical protein GGQ84_002438 [Desulfitispora alkaliphila]|uniref:hypothetical protein n=1 Tax=Desulfitispora alkaliphila TaxID=622674 RepID=UPI003D205D23